ncbi:MAG TPA: sigma-54-dependent Fis family transcriptional regulator [Bacillus bacterium]|uniref:Sigma-54-dependent Fis family transcriptional regulator n=1 Tax=Siminovitchia fordii TaxID=254759 RepID=A0ABQ4K1G1_9BACI|nr:sigma 54-interacting transcriptional regulator [Siminovitchia fordii]GIN19572.1 sigma-54-dependent Fis family transcriptional regulator [Siminovitchia fordii]HBZ11519.1 sigma-54-dependent Fis family transcriptional regulator [Bacillus sp. (in: firmicutes)]
MINIKLVVPRKGYIKDAMKRFEDFTLQEKKDAPKEDMEFRLEEVVIPTDKIHEVEVEADVIISRGLVTKLLKEHNESTPIVDIPVQGIDLIRSLVDCKERFGRKKVAVIGAANMIYGVENLESIIDLPIQKYILEDITASDRTVDLAASDGCEIVLSGMNTNKYAERIGLKTMLIETGKESFRQALVEAKRLAVVSRKEQEKSKRYQTILDHAYEGVIAVDLKKNISVFNSSAQQILSIFNEHLIGAPIESVLIKGKLLGLLLSGNDFQEEIVNYNSIQLSVKKAGIFLKGKKTGDMIAFQDVTGIQEMEGKIRKKIHSRGLVAKYSFNDILFKSELIGQTIETAKLYSEADSNILIVGETGTGKEMFAQSIHNYSDRRNNPFVAINCAALPESLLESELFGYAEGAFTGAMKGGKQGFFELAHRGTLFLDEIGEISPNLQSRLLRVLQEREIMRIGDDKVIPVDVRIIAATNKNLMNMVKNNDFRADLFYRLSVLDLHLPPLREHREDIPVLAEAFIKNSPLTDEAKERLMEEEWEGNVRQLQNFCERLTVLCKDQRIDVFDIEKHLPKRTEAKAERTFISERERILNALEKHHFHRGKAASELGMSRTTFWRKMKKWKIETE